MPAYYNEHDEFAASWLRKLIGAGLVAPGDVDQRSIADVRPGDLDGYTQCHFFAGIGGWSRALRLAGWDDERPVWTGSCPCQPFSLAGQQRGFADERHLWPVWRKLIAERRPARIFGEQVASASQWLGLVRGDLEALEYAVGAIPFEAASAGADHLRNRYGLVAHDDRQRQQAGRRYGSQGVDRQGLAGEGHGEAVEGAGGSCNDVADNNNKGSQGRTLLPERTGQRTFGADGVADATIIAERKQTDKADAVATGGEARPLLGGGGINLGDTIGDGWREGRHYHAEHDGSVAAAADQFEWVIGADGKARRVKPGIRLLVDGFPNRVGLLRGFGNAIDPRAFAQFIAAADEAIGDYVRSVGGG